MRRRREPREELKVTVTIRGEEQIEMWRAMCFVFRRSSHQLANELVLDEIEYHQDDPQLRRLARDARRRTRGISIVR